MLHKRALGMDLIPFYYFYNMLKNSVFALLLLLFCNSVIAQDKVGFSFMKSNQKSYKLKFELVNNLIVIPVELNGVKLKFLLDTGVNKTLLITIGSGDSLFLNKTQQVNIHGLGFEDKFEAFQSNGNHLQIGGIVNSNQEIFFIIDEQNELSNRLGLPVNGIIGYDLFKDFVVRINYKQKYIKLYHPDHFNRKLRRYEMLPLQFFKNKPYVSLQVKDQSVSKNNLNFLLDTGNGSSFWLIESDYIKIPELYFNDVLGFGLSSTIEGKRSKVKQINFGKYSFTKPNVAYPDVEQIRKIESNVVRDGTIGTEILRRFKLFIDYPNKRLYFRANNNLYDPFNYDMSGLSFHYDGVKVVEEIKSVLMNPSQDESEYASKNTFLVSVEVKPKISVHAVREKSPAAEAEIFPGDELLSINGKKAYDLKLEKIQSILSDEHGQKVKLEFLRNDKKIKKQLYLKDRFKDLLSN